MPNIIVHHRDGTRAAVPLSSRPIKLGRADTCEIVLRNDSEVSREHAQVWLDELGRVVVADLNSKNGTRVDNGEVFRNASRIATQSIRLGEHEIEITGAPPARPPAAAGVIFTPDAPTLGSDTRFFPSSKQLRDLSKQRLELLIALSQRLGGKFERKELLEHALDACCDALGFERGLIVVKTPRGDTELPVSRNVARDETGAYKVSRTLINEALVHGRRAVVNNPATDLVGNLSESLVRFPINSALCVPILNRDEILGVIYGDRITGGNTRAYDDDDVDFLAAIAQQVGVGIANVRLLQEHLKSQRVYAELDQARAIQKRLLPSAPLTVGRVTFEGYNEPSSEVGGDCFDYFTLGDGRIGFIIADVSGHGLPASLIMANLQAAVRVALAGTMSLSDLACQVNRLICGNTSPDVFITGILGTVDPVSGSIEFVNAGHPIPICFGGFACRLSPEDNSLPLGYEPDETYRVQRIEPGAAAGAVLLYTDGLFEATDPAGRELGIDPIVRALREVPDFSPATLIRTTRGVLRAHLDGGDNRDDMTLLALHFSELKDYSGPLP